MHCLVGISPLCGIASADDQEACGKWIQRARMTHLHHGVHLQVNRLDQPCAVFGTDIAQTSHGMAGLLSVALLLHTFFTPSTPRSLLQTSKDVHSGGLSTNTAAFCHMLTSVRSVVLVTSVGGRLVLSAPSCVAVFGQLHTSRTLAVAFVK